MPAEKASIFQTLGAVLFVTLLQLGILFHFRQLTERLPGLSYSALILVEMFFVWLLAVRGIPYLLGRSKRSSQ
jgi:hypothetical protein